MPSALPSMTPNVVPPADAFRTTYTDTDPVADQLIDAIEASEFETPESPLYSAIDPDVLDDLFLRGGDDVQEFDGRLVFRYGRLEITVTSACDIWIEAQA